MVHTLVFALIMGEPRVPPPTETEPVSVWRSLDGDIATTFHRTAEGFLVRFCDLADYAIDISARTVVCSPVPDIDPELIESLFANQIEPLLRTWDGDLVLHASGVAIDDRAVGFLGLSRRGKSTLATALARAGHPCVTDDGLILLRTQSGFLAEPKCEPLRLLPDSEAALLGDRSGGPYRATKARISLPGGIGFQKEPIALAALYHLCEPCSSGLKIERLSQSAAMDIVLKQSFMLDTGDKARMRAHFDRVAVLAETVPVFSLDYPRDYDQLPNVLDGIIAHQRETCE